LSHKEIHLAQLLVPSGLEFMGLKSFIWLVRHRCASQGYFVGECQDALRGFVRDRFPGWDFSQPWYSHQLGAFQLKVGPGKGEQFLPDQSKQFSLLGCSADNFTTVLTKETMVMFRS
jgi:hypothetical protein